MAKGKRRYWHFPRRSRRRRAKLKIPLAATIGLAGSAFVSSPWSGGHSVASRLMEGNWLDAGKIAVRHYTGIDPYNGSWDPFAMVGTYTALAGGIISLVASKSGINRYLSKVPYIKI
jgi:hypothetical protein